MSTTLKMTRQIIWPTIIFLAITTLGAVVGVPLYVYHHGFSWFDFNLFLVFSALTGLSITVGYHRHFSHCNYKTNRFVQFLLLFFGAGAFEMSAYDWSSLHRDHHRYVDTNDDPYSIKKGFWYAHIGWMIFWKHTINYYNAKDLQKNKMLMHQAKYYTLWAVFSGIILPVALGALTGHALGAFIIAVCMRLVFVYNATFCINSVCHLWGNQPHGQADSSRDSWAVSLLTFGEGYHNYHHTHPTDYRNGPLWYNFDPSKWVIFTLSLLGLAWSLRTANAADPQASNL
jgi:stearoyl-CoA desaturase (delta-9 desaturase)